MGLLGVLCPQECSQHALYLLVVLSLVLPENLWKRLFCVYLKVFFKWVLGNKSLYQNLWWFANVKLHTYFKGETFIIKDPVDVLLLIILMRMENRMSIPCFDYDWLWKLLSCPIFHTFTSVICCNNLNTAELNVILHFTQLFEVYIKCKTLL